jgi:hypothetical protein
MRRLLICLVWLIVTTTAASASDLSFDSFYAKQGVSGWWIALGLLVAGGIAVATAGGATPFITAIGTSIGNAAGYAGAAATNYGLAMLGGGSLAAGGLGVKGGILVLTAALTMSRQAAVPLADYVFEQFDQAAFQERTKSLPRLPMPRADAGSDGTRQVVALLRDHYNENASFDDEGNRKKVDVAIHDLTTRFAIELPISAKNVTSSQRADTARLASILGILRFHQGDDTGAKVEAAKAMLLVLGGAPGSDTPTSGGNIGSAFQLSTWAAAQRAGQGYATPAAVWALASLGAPDVDISASISALDTVMGLEPTNARTIHVVSLFLARLSERLDVATADDFAKIKSSIDLRLKDPKIREAALLTLMTRTLLVARARHDYIAGFADAKQTTAQRKKAAGRLDQAFVDHGNALDLIDAVLVDLLAGTEFAKVPDNRSNLQGLRKSISNHREARIALNKAVDTAKVPAIAK